jgi:hypothetical protein
VPVVLYFLRVLSIYYQRPERSIAEVVLVVPSNILHPSSPKEEESWAQIEAEECEPAQPGTPFRFQIWNQLRATH